jgi:hypothetical protein
VDRLREDAACGEQIDDGDRYPDVRPSLAALRAGGVWVGVAGNQTPRAAQLLRTLDLPVDYVGTSGEWDVAKPNRGFFERVVDIAPGRQMIATPLAACPLGEWIDMDALFAAIRNDDLIPTIARNDTALWRLYPEDPQYGSLGYDGFHDWALLEGRYTLAVVFGYAATLGLVDLDYTNPAGARDDFRTTGATTWTP